MEFKLYKRRPISDDELIAEIKKVMNIIGKDILTMKDFDTYASVNCSTVIRRFGSWNKALQSVGAESGNHFHSEMEMMENIKTTLKNAKENLKEFKSNLKKEYKQKFEKLIEVHKDTINSLKESFSQKVENNKENIKLHHEYFQENRTEIYALIEEFRANSNISI